MPRYILRLSLEHPTFRLPSLKSIADLYGFPLRFISEDKLRSVLIIELEKDEDAEKFLERGVLVMQVSEANLSRMSVCRLIAEGSSYEEMHQQVQADLSVFEPYMDKKFKFEFESINHRSTSRRQRGMIDSFTYCGLSKVDIKNPEVEFVIFEDYDKVSAHTHEHRLSREGEFIRVYFGRRIGFSTARPLILKHDIKQRTFYGNTSMEAEMGFLMAGQALPAPGKIIYDPFAGTGSLLYAVAHWGAYVFGSDIDGRQMRGKTRGKDVVPGMLRAAEQYGVRDKFLDLFTFDVTQNPLRRGGWVDSIVTDPPYGVRAGAKRLGKRATKKTPTRDGPCLMPDGTYSHENPDYNPPCRPYEMANLTLDIILLARYLLVPGGRLVFFIPTITEEWDEVDLPVVEGMRELKCGSGSVQEFHSWGRRLITMEKTAQDDGPPPTFPDHREVYEVLKGRVPGHHNFGQRYFERLKPRVESVDTEPVLP